MELKKIRLVLFGIFNSLVAIVVFSFFLKGWGMWGIFFSYLYSYFQFFN